MARSERKTYLPLVSADSTVEERSKLVETGRNGDGSAESAILANLSRFGSAKRAKPEEVAGLGARE